MAEIPPKLGEYTHHYLERQGVEIHLETTLESFDDRGAVLSDGTFVPAGSGDVVGPAGAVPGHIAEFDDATGKLLQDAGYSVADILALIGAGGGGDVVGPASAVADQIAIYNGTTGKVIKDGGKTISGVLADADAAADAALAAHAADADAHKGQKDSIELDAGDLHLVGDELAPGNNKVYGTDASGVKGWPRS